MVLWGLHRIGSRKLQTSLHMEQGRFSWQLFEMDLFAHQLIDSIEIVGDPLRKSELLWLIALLCFFHIYYFEVFMTNTKIKMSQTSRQLTGDLDDIF